MTENGPSFYQRSYVWILLVFLASIPLIVHGLIRSHASSNNNIRQWLPAEFEATQVYEYFYEHFGTDEFALVTWEGCTLDDPRLPRFVEVLDSYKDEDGERLFANANTGVSLLATLEGKFGLPHEVALQRLKGIVVGRDGSSTAAIVTLTDKGDTNRRKTVEAMRRLAIDKVGIPEADLHMAGDAVTNAEVDIASQDAIGSLVVYSMIIALACACIGLRDVRLVFVVFCVAVYCSVLAECLVPLLGGNMNLVLVVMPVLVYVLGLSAGVHLVNYYRDAISESGEDRAPYRAIQFGWMPCTLAAGTTAIGLGSLCVSHIRPVKDFGTYSALGILASLVILFLLLPALLVLKQKTNRWFGSTEKKAEAQQTSMRTPSFFDRAVSTCGDFVTRNHVQMTVVCLAILAIVGWGTLSINTSVKPRRFFKPESRLLTDYAWITDEDRFGPQVPIELVLAFDHSKTSMNTLQQLKLVGDLEQYLRETKSHVIGSTISAATFAPVLDPSRLERYPMNERLAESRKAFRNVHFYSVETTREGNKRELWRISARVEQSDLDYDVVIRQVEEHVSAFLAARREQQKQDIGEVKQRYHEGLAEAAETYDVAKMRYQHEPNVLAHLTREYKDFVFNSERKYSSRLDALVDDSKDVEVLYTGMVPLFYEAQNELLDGLFKSFILAFVLIAVLMVVWFRNVNAGLVTMLPNVFPAAVIFGFMGWRGMIVDIGSMMTASVAMGIAVDDTVHFLTWFRRGLQEGMSRRDAILHSYRRCAMAMGQTTMIAGFGLLVFSLSSFQPVSQFGLLMFVLLVAALVGDLIFLPALLSGPAGKLFEPRRARRRMVAETQPVA